MAELQGGSGVTWAIPRRPLGAHMSIAGGFERAVERAATVGCTALQIFTKSSNQWAAKPLGSAEAERFKEGLAAAGIRQVVAHDSYLINLCSPDEALWKKSIDACVLELQRCEALGVPWLVAHPGGHMGQGEPFGIRRMSEALDEIYARVPERRASIAIELTAGQGTVIGYRFEQIAAIIDGTKHPGRTGVCLDTCHIFAAGYDLRTPRAYEETMRRFEETIGFARLRAVHVNDSKKDLGGRVDRHEHIGKGFLGLEAFRLLMNDSRFLEVPLILETPKSDDCHEDVENLTALIGLVAGATPGRGGASRA